MTVIVLGWGSLIWNPERFRIAGQWFRDGPQLPVEFARVSRDGRLTLVLYPRAEKLPVLWAQAATDDLDQAIEDLREREKTVTRRIGFLSIADGRMRCNVVPEAVHDIRRWGQEKDADAVIWTDMRPYFEKPTGTRFTQDNVIIYLEGLPKDARRRAEEYVRRAPPQIRTEMRKVIEERLGWTPKEDWNSGQVALVQNQDHRSKRTGSNVAR